MRNSSWSLRVFALSVPLIVVPQLPATMLIIIYTPDGFWLGADSARETGGFRTGTVCKVHETKWGILLKAGNSQGTSYNGDHYSTDKEVEDVVSKSTDVAEFENNLRLQFKKDIDAELAFLVNDPAVTPNNLETTRFDNPIPADTISTLIRITLLVKTAEVSPGEVLMVVPKSDVISTDGPQQPKYKYWAPSILGWHPTIDLLPQAEGPDGIITFPGPVRMFGELVTYSKPDAWVQTHPKEAMLEMFRLGQTQFSNTVGPPYVLVHVIQTRNHKSSIRWIVKGVCPSWSDKVDAPSSSSPSGISIASRTKGR